MAHRQALEELIRLRASALIAQEGVAVVLMPVEDQMQRHHYGEEAHLPHTLGMDMRVHRMDCHKWITRMLRTVTISAMVMVVNSMIMRAL